MLVYESFTEEEIRIEAENFAEDADLPFPSFNEAMNVYLNSKPSTWRLISHCMFGSYTKHQFIWSTGE